MQVKLNNATDKNYITLRQTDGATLKLREDLINTLIEYNDQTTAVHIDGPGADIIYKVREAIGEIPAPRCLALFNVASDNITIAVDPDIIYSLRASGNSPTDILLVSSNKNYGNIQIKQSIDEAERIIAAARDAMKIRPFPPR